MELKLAKCARCTKLFSKIHSEVCDSCQPDEDSDFNKIHEVISRRRGITASEVATEAEVPIDCVYRMLREGRIDNVESDHGATCGRCGAPAISSTKRLCERCLIVLDRDCAHAMLEMRQRIRSKEESDMHDIQEAVSKKRASKKSLRDLDLTPDPDAKPEAGRRMVASERFGKKKK